MLAAASNVEAAVDADLVVLAVPYVAVSAIADELANSVTARLS